MSEAPAPAPAPDGAESAQFLLSLAVACQVRGGYSLADAVALHRVHASAQTKSALDGEDVALVQSLVLQSQALGKLELHEAWMAYNALQIIQRLAG